MKPLGAHPCVLRQWTKIFPVTESGFCVSAGMSLFSPWWEWGQTRRASTLSSFPMKMTQSKWPLTWKSKVRGCFKKCDPISVWKEFSYTFCMCVCGQTEGRLINAPCALCVQFLLRLKNWLTSIFPERDTWWPVKLRGSQPQQYSGTAVTACSSKPSVKCHTGNTRGLIIHAHSFPFAWPHVHLQV